MPLEVCRRAERSRGFIFTAVSFAEASPIISDYAEKAGKVRTVAADLSHNQPGGPNKLAEVRLIWCLGDITQPQSSVDFGRYENLAISNHPFFMDGLPISLSLAPSCAVICRTSEVLTSELSCAPIANSISYA